MQQGIAMTKAFQLRAYTKKELCNLYGIQAYTFRKWLKEIPETADTGRKNWLDVSQVEAILKAKGVPGEREFK
jgi:predicted site-specific integrase-resolvase